MGDNREGIRLQVYLARCGIGSRRKCEEYIQEGRASVNGEVVREAGVKVQAESDRITFDGRTVRLEESKVYIALNKPVKYLCTNYDPEERPLALDLIKGVSKNRLFSVGRLDYMSSGLLLFTNDGDFADIISHPSYEIEKVYVVETDRRIEEEHLKRFLSGVRIDGIRYQILSYRYKTPFKVELTLNEGKKREIRIFFGHFRYKIKRLHRIRVGTVALKGLAAGEFRFLTRKEIDYFFKKKGRGS